MSSHCSMHSLQTSKLIRIDSKDKSITSHSQYDMEIDFNDYMLHQIKRVILKSVYIPNTMYNVNQYNNQLVYDAGAGNVIITVPVGQYSITQLMDYLVAQFILGPYGTVTYVNNLMTNKLELTFDANIILRSSSTISEVLGMDSYVDTSNLSVHSLPHIYNLSGLLKVYIGSHTIAKGTTMSSSDKTHLNIFTEIPMRVSYGAIEHRVLDVLESTDEVTHSIPFNMSSIDITLYDQNLNIVDLNGLEYQIVLKVFM